MPKEMKAHSYFSIRYNFDTPEKAEGFRFRHQVFCAGRDIKVHMTIPTRDFGSISVFDTDRAWAVIVTYFYEDQ